MVEDIIERPFITVGFSAFVILIPLALTSTKGWMRRLGTRWAKLHRGIYFAATFGVVHFYWLAKSKADVRLPLLLAFCLSVLLVYRVLGWLETRRRTIARSHRRNIN
jgi:sulfoxide reductase heme-binding subunit YedZ